MPAVPSTVSSLHPGSVLYQLPENVEKATTPPAGSDVYVATKDDCISSIAKTKGHYWQKIWDHPPNAHLKSTRDPNILKEGDRVVIPPKTEKQESGATEMEHTFRRKGEPAMVRIRVEGHANQEYTLVIDGDERRGTTDETGLLEQPIPGNARRGKLIIGPEQEEFQLELGAIEPIDTELGVRQRLGNLSYDCGPGFKSAIAAFQSDHGLKPTGEADAQTKTALVKEHGS